MQKYKFQRQIILKNIIIVAAVIVALTAVAAGYTFAKVRSSFEEQMNVQMKGVVSQVDTALQLADEVALQLAANNFIINTFRDVQNYTGSNNYFNEYTDQDAELKQYMMSYMLKQNSIGRICLLDDQENFIFSGRAVDYGYLKKDCQNQEFYDDAQVAFTENKQAKMFKVDVQDPYVNDEVSVISAIREIKDYQIIPSERLGYVQVQVPMEIFQNAFSKVLADGTECYIFEENRDEPIFTYGEPWKYKTSNSLKSGYISKGVYSIRNEFEEYHISIVLVSQNTALVVSMFSTFAWMFLLIICIIFIIWMGQVQVIKKTTEPIARLCDVVGSLHADENLKEIPLITSENDNELLKLNLAFDSLIKKLKDSMERVMTSRVNEIQSQMFALQAQMNPHFIHNILSVVSAMSTDGESEKIPEICEKLSDMIHYNTRFNANYTEFEEEIKYAENYLELMKIRYEDKFRYSMVYVGEIRSFRIPRFIIQPLLENCFAHGFKKKTFPWIIDIQVLFMENVWEIRIRDNGSGIEAEKQKQIQEQLNEIRNKELTELIKELRIGGLSLKNVFVRLYIAYGEDLIFDIENSEHGAGIVIGGKYDDTGNGS